MLLLLLLLLTNCGKPSISSKLPLDISRTYAVPPLVTTTLGSRFHVKHTISSNSLQQICDKLNVQLQAVVDQEHPYRATNQKLIDILLDLCALYKLRLMLKDDRAILTNDTSFTALHNASFLYQTSSTSSNTSTEHQGAGSTTQVETKTVRDCMQELEGYLTFLSKQKIETDGQEQEISYSINKHAGIIALHAPFQTHMRLVEYLHKLDLHINAQVRIEAKILQVALKNEFKMGINWSGVIDSAAARVPSSLAISNNDSATSFTVNTTAGISGVIDTLQEYGTTQIICKPELTLLNNQSGIFKVSVNDVYFKLKTHQVGSSNKHETHTNLVHSAEPKIIQTGFSMIVQPCININTYNIALHIKPSITDVQGYVQDPSVSILNKQIKSQYPITDTKEFDTKLTLKPGQWVVLGGYIMTSKKHHRKGLPGVKILPILGTTHAADSKQEIVCIIRAFPSFAHIASKTSRVQELCMS